MPDSNGSIFINYRKDDSNWNALALYNELQKYFAPERLFKDFNAIQLGDDFVARIHNALTKCDVLLVVISRQWLHVKNANHVRRLDDPDDYVRMEIATALERGIQVIPVLFDNTPIPTPQELPENLRLLSRRQAIEINPTGFEDDLKRLAIAIKNILHEDTANVFRNQDNKSNGNEPKVNIGMPPKPDNYLLWAIISTVICCLPLGIASILQASKVDSLYNSGKYGEANDTSLKGKKWATYAAITGVVLYVLYFILIALGSANPNRY